jgi:hypothetical protein
VDPTNIHRDPPANIHNPSIHGSAVAIVTAEEGESATAYFVAKASGAAAHSVTKAGLSDEASHVYQVRARSSRLPARASGCQHVHQVASTFALQALGTRRNPSVRCGAVL